MRRFWVLLLTEIKAWRHDPLSVMGGFIAPLVMILSFGLLFGGQLGFGVAVLNLDEGPRGGELRQAFDEVLSPFGTPYYDVLDLSEDEAWEALRSSHIEGVWVVPPDFSRRVDAGDNPRVEMHFSNYNDDRAKNHRIYAAEILWRFYEKIGRPDPPIALAEEYPRPAMIDWFALIGVGLVLFGVTLGAMFNVFMLTYKEQVTRVTLEFSLAPRSLLWVLLPKVLLALTIGLATGAGLMLVLYLWRGIWPGPYLWAAVLLAALVAPLWIAIALVLGLRARHYMAGAVGSIASGVIVFFVAGGLSSPAYYPTLLRWIAALLPNSYAVDPLRELILFQSWPANWVQTLAILVAFSAASLAVGLTAASRQLRRPG
jgi:ABC-2 type transport system permease protein